MKRAMVVVAVVLSLACLGFVAFAMSLPEAYFAERSVVVDSSPQMVFDYVSEQANHEKFSPWKDKDPTMQMTFNDVGSGVGASYSWTSEESGAGTSTITKVDAPKTIETDLEFEGMGKSQGYWVFESKDNSTKVTWGFRAKADGLMDRVMGSMMDSFIGADFERGLALLKEQVESLPAEENVPDAIADQVDAEAQPKASKSE